MPAPAVDATSTVVAASTNSAQGVSTAAFQKGGALEQWIAKDLKDGGWDRTGITAGMVNAAHTQTGGLRTFRVNIVGEHRAPCACVLSDAARESVLALRLSLLPVG